ncbi:MAG: hypothetical protein GF347_00875 [Candidatus Moranbacteria bacterium]|nr:hypothetical protein [Candidatus Moranbacteria bacterium]
MRIKKIKYLFLAVLLIVVSLSFGLKGYAQEEEVIEVEFETVANVNIDEAKIISQTGNDLTLRFTVFNGKGVQPGVKYTVSLFRKGDLYDAIDSYTYPASLDLGENRTITKQIDFSAPSFLNGEFDLYLNLKNSEGLPLASYKFKTVTLEGSGDYLEIDPRTCKMLVGEEEFPLMHGVDVNSDEELKIECAVKNQGGPITAAVKFETNYRSKAGAKVKVAEIEAQTLELASGEEKTFSFVVPKAVDPQAYHVKLILEDGGKTVSNSVFFQYVLRGASATINNLNLNKDYYKKGDNLEVEFSWSPSADSFPGSRFGPTDLPGLKAKINVVDSNNKECILETEQNLDPRSPGAVTLKAKTIAECKDPMISAKIMDDEGRVLAMKNDELQSISIRTEKKEDLREGLLTQPDKSDLTIKLIILGVITLILVIVLLIFFMRNRGNKTKGVMMFLISVLAAGLMFSVNLDQAQAETFRVTDIDLGGDIDWNHDDSFSVNVSPASLLPTLDNQNAAVILTPGNEIEINSTPLTYTTCGNFALTGGNITTFHGPVGGDIQYNDLSNLGNSHTYFAASDCDNNPYVVGYRVELEFEVTRGNDAGQVFIAQIEKKYYYKVECNVAFQCVVGEDTFRAETSTASSACGRIGNVNSPKNYIRGDEENLSSDDLCVEGYAAQILEGDEDLYLGYLEGESADTIDGKDIASAIENAIKKEEEAGETVVFAWNCAAGVLDSKPEDGTLVTCLAAVTDNPEIPIGDPDQPSDCNIPDANYDWDQPCEALCTNSGSVDSFSLTPPGYNTSTCPEPPSGTQLKWFCRSNDGTELSEECVYPQEIESTIFEGN